MNIFFQSQPLNQLGFDQVPPRISETSLRKKIKDEIKPSLSSAVLDPLDRVWSLSCDKNDKDNKNINTFD
jgi:hypothetical protein